MKVTFCLTFNSYDDYDSDDSYPPHYEDENRVSNSNTHRGFPIIYKNSSLFAVSRYSYVVEQLNFNNYRALFCHRGHFLNIHVLKMMYFLSP